MHFDLDYYARLRGLSNEEIRQTFEWRVPDRVNAGIEVCDRHAEAGRDLAFRWIGIDGSRRDVSFSELRQQSARVANLLVEEGVLPGDRVFTVLPRIPEHWMVLVGAMKAGAIVSSQSTTFGEDAIAVRMHDARPRVVFTVAAHLHRVEASAQSVGARVIVVDNEGRDGLAARLSNASDRFAPVLCASTDPAFLFYTSGTTGTPKGSMHSIGQLAGGVALMFAALDLRDGDVFWPTSDLGWVTGFLFTFSALTCGQPFITYQGEFDAERWWQIMHEERVTNFFAVPTAYRMLRQGDGAIDRNRLDLCVRQMGTVGEPLDPETLAWARRRLGAPIYEVYGQTETGAGACANRPGSEIRPGSLGQALPYLTVAIVDEEGNEVPPGQEGEIATRPGYPAITLGYLDRPEATAEIFRNGWHYTGDMAHVDEDGYIWFHARSDDVITSSGYRIGPTEVEAALLSHTDVHEAAVVGKPDPARGHIVKAWVVAKPGVTPDDALASALQAHCKQHAGGWNYPREVEFIDELPKTVTGKIRRVELREIEAERARMIQGVESRS